MIGRTLGRYRIVESLGAGGMGQVYRAEDARLGRSVALKILKPRYAAETERLERFEREARAVAALDHPNIVTIYSIEEIDGLHVLTMQFVEGKTLTASIPRHGFPLDAFLALAIQTADAVSAAHDKGIVHRDLKPSNIMISADGRARVLDFGVAKLREGLRGDGNTQLPTEELTAEGRILGTAAYMSPEQAAGQPVDERSDVFSLAIILYEMATGVHPFKDGTQVPVTASILRDTPVSVTEHRPELPRHLGRIIKHGLEKDLRRRYQSALDLRNDLQELKDEIDSGELLPTSTGSWAAPVSGRSPWPLALVAAALLLIGAAAAWLVLAPRRQPIEPVRSVPLTSWEGSELDPALSPRGDQVAFVWDGETAGSFDLFVMLVGSGEPLRLTTGPGAVRSPSWSPDGLEIAFLRSSERGGFEVVAVPALGGAERKLGRLSSPGFPGLDWSPDGHRLAVVDTDAQTASDAIFLLSKDSGERRRLTRPASSSVGDKLPVFSPDGRSLAFVRWHEMPLSEVFVVDPDGGEPTLLAAHDGWIRGMDWLPDGSALVFASVWEGTSGLWRLTRSGELSPLGFGQNARVLSVAATGRRLVFSQHIPQTNLWRVGGPAADGSAEHRKLIASTRNDWAPHFSPDGAQIAFSSDRTGQPRIWVSDAEGARPAQLATGEAAAAIMPRWGPDGRSVFFSQSTNGGLDVFAIALDEGFPRRLTESEGLDLVWDFSADGEWLYLFSDRTGAYEVSKMPAGGGEPIQLTRTGGLLPLESADGRFVYYLKQTVPLSIWRLELESGEESQVLERAGLTVAGFDLWQDSLVFLVDDEERGPRFERFDLDTRQLDTIVELGLGTVMGKYGRITVSPDGRWIVYPRDDSRGNDLILIEGFG